MPGHGIPDIGMPMVAANWAPGVVSPLLGQALLVGIVLPTLGQALLWALSCPCWAVNCCCWHYPPSGGCYRLLALLLLAVHGIIFVGCSWHYFCWLFMALLLLAFHGTIIILAVALGEWPLQHYPNLCLAALYLVHAR